jgi:hypothetical protein
MQLGETGGYKAKDSWFILPSTNAESRPRRQDAADRSTCASHSRPLKHDGNNIAMTAPSKFRRLCLLCVQQERPSFVRPLLLVRSERLIPVS